MIISLDGIDETDLYKSFYDFDVLNNSFTKGAGNKTGAFGEIAVLSYYNSLGIKANSSAGNRNFDILINGFKIEIKTAKYKKKPKPPIFYKINSFSLHQRPDFYIFCQYYEMINSVKICGMISFKNFIDNARALKAGTYSFIHSDCIALSEPDFNILKQKNICQFN